MPTVTSENKAEFDRDFLAKKSGKAKPRKSILSLIKKHGEEVLSQTDAQRRLSGGDRIFVFHEQGSAPMEVTSVEELKNHAPDQMMAIPAHIEI
jgi:hypothetical protein